MEVEAYGYTFKHQSSSSDNASEAFCLSWAFMAPTRSSDSPFWAASLWPVVLISRLYGGRLRQNLRISVCIDSCVLLSSFASFFSISRLRSQLGLFGAILNTSFKRIIKRVGSTRFMRMKILDVQALGPSAAHLRQWYSLQGLRHSFQRCPPSQHHLLGCVFEVSATLDQSYGFWEVVHPYNGMSQ